MNKFFFSKMKKNLIIKILLGAILFLALVLRVYKLDLVPPSISWDEAAVGYNAYTIANFGQDEYGKTFPFFFRSFADDKHPIHVYFTALSVKFLGLSEFSVRFPSAVFGVLNVLLIFFLARLMFRSVYLGLIASFFLAISPYNIHFSRFNHEANFALFFFMLGLYLFFKSLKKSSFLPLSVLSLCITFITYHPAKIVVPVVLLTLLVLYIRKILLNKKNIVLAFVVVLLFVVILAANHELLGIARISQTSQNSREVEKTNTFQLTHNQLLGRVELIATQYSWHFSPQFLFIQGDKNPRLSSQTGEFYKIDAIFLILGIVYLLYKRSRESLILLTWALVAPLPSAMVAEAPHTARAMYMMGSWHLISALGFYFFVSFFKKSLIKWIVIIITLIALIFSLSSYLSYYFGEYSKRYAIEWQYGMKQVVEFVRDNAGYNQIYMADVRSQPYIFFLHYLKIPLPEYLNSVIYNNSESKSYNLISSFDKFFFGGSDTVESKPGQGVLYILTPSEYDGLRYKSSFDVKKIIYYPNGTVAFYIIS